MPRPAVAFILTTLLLSACASPRRPPAPVDEVSAVVPAGVTPLTVEQEEDSARVLPDRLPPGGRIG